MHKNLLVILLSVFAFSNCKKESRSSPDILTSRTWKMGLNDLNPQTNSQGQTLYYPVQTCEKDDTFKFTQDGNFIINRNIDKCNENELQIESQTYTLNRQTKKLIINGTVFTLVEVSNSQVKYYAPIPSTNGFKYQIFLLQ